MKRHIVLAILLAAGVTTLTASGDTNLTETATNTAAGVTNASRYLLNQVPESQLTAMQESWLNIKGIYNRLMGATTKFISTPVASPATNTITPAANGETTQSLDPLDIILTLASKVEQNKQLTAAMKENLLHVKSAYQQTTVVAKSAVNGAVCNLSQIVNLPEQNAINPDLYKLATTAYMCAIKAGMDNQRILTIVDYTLPSTQKRMWVFDLNHNRVLFNSYVAHGKGSGAVMAQTFSDQPDTHASSIGLFLTGNVYRGHDGYSLKLYGLEKGFNDKAFEREIVIHGAPYVSEQRAKAGGLGRSWGCLALPLDQVQKIIDTVKQGSLIFSYYPDQKWLSESKFLHCMGEANQAPAKN